jgi:hypothetical protein
MGVLHIQTIRIHVDQLANYKGSMYSLHSPACHIIDNLKRETNYLSALIREKIKEVKCLYTDLLANALFSCTTKHFVDFDTC